MFKLDLERAEEPEIKLPISAGSLKKQESSRKTSTSLSLTKPKPLTVSITTDCGKFFNRWEYQTTWSSSWVICMQVKKQQLELDMEQETGSKLRKDYLKAVYCHPTYLNYLQSSVQSLNHGRLFTTSWNAARQASLSITNSWSLLKLMSIKSVMPASHLDLCHPLLFLLSISPSIRVFSSESLHQVAKVLEFQLQHQSFQWIFRTDFL